MVHTPLAKKKHVDLEQQNWSGTFKKHNPDFT